MKLSSQAQTELKRAVGYRAADDVEEGMLIGLGTGSTATYFIERLIARVKKGLRITAVASSQRSAEQATQGGVIVLDMNTITTIDLTVDGADEIDLRNQMIKGGGGAHVREKIVASSSKQMIVIVDESKLVETLGTFGLPVEILPFGYKATIHKLEQLGYRGTVRVENKVPFVTDNGNLIFDIHTPKTFENPHKDHLKIISTVGVVETGFFLDIPVKVLVGYQDGHIAFRT